MLKIKRKSAKLMHFIFQKMFQLRKSMDFFEKKDAALIKFN